MEYAIVNRVSFNSRILLRAKASKIGFALTSAYELFDSL